MYETPPITAMALAIIAVALIVLYLYNTRTFKYWEKKGIKHDKPVVFFGNFAKSFLLQQSMTQAAADIYWKYPNEKVVGSFRSTRPELVVRDPEIVKRMLTTDFAYFHRRGMNPHKTVIEPLLRNLIFADGDLWRLLRQCMTPAFTSGKLKAMFPLIAERAERLQARVSAVVGQGRPLDARDLMARYTTDFIGAVGFGLDPDSLNDENSAFQKLGISIFTPGVIGNLKGGLKVIFPNLFKHAKYLKRVEKQIVDLVYSILKQRNYEPSGRNDFLDLMLECQKKGKMEADSLEKLKPDGRPDRVSMELTDELIAAQVFIFFAAGFETSSSSSSYVLHQLAYNPEVQKKVQAEIDTVLARHNNKLSYDAVKEMTYLECTLKEGMRILPTIGNLVRECARPYTIPELGVTIDEGVGVIIPLQALHNDPQYFEEPQQFRPERFLPEAVKESNKHVYLPFGDGPRACIGLRLGMMQSLAGLAAVLSRFSVSPGPTTVRYPLVEPNFDVIQRIRGGVPLLFTERP